MKKLKYNQFGFGAIEVILVIVIIGIIGAVGWYVLKSKNNTTTSYNNAASSSTATKPKNSLECMVKDSGALTIKEWGVSAKYNGTLQLCYKIADGSAVPQTASFSSKELGTVSKDCVDWGGGSINRAKLDQDIYEGSVGLKTTDFIKQPDAIFGHVGDYYYGFIVDQSGCGESANIVKIRKQTTDAVKTIVPILK